MAIFRVWTWKEGNVYRGESDEPLLSVTAGSREEVEHLLRVRLLAATGVDRVALDVRHTTPRDRRVAQLNVRSPVLDPEDIRAVYEAYGIGDLAEGALASAEPAVAVTARPLRSGEALSAGQSRLGGDPDLPRQTTWPNRDGVPLYFLGQFRLSELPSFPAADREKLLLPQRGLLWLWYDAAREPWGFKPNDETAWQVWFEEDESIPLSRVAAPARPSSAPPMYRACRLEMRRIVSLAHADGAASIHDLSDLYARDLIEGEHCHQVRGQVDLEDVPTRDNERPLLLFKIGTDQKGPGWCWCDAGELYFWISRVDLARRDFSRVFGTLDSP